MEDVTACPVCDGESFVERYPATFDGDWRDAVPYFLTGRTKVVHGRIVRCRDCSFSFTSPQFAAAEYRRIYAAVCSSSKGIGEPRARFDELARFVRRTETTGRFLDFGCGNGGFLDAMSGYNGVGLEISADGPEGVVQHGRIITGDILAETLPATGLSFGSFDFIVAWDVLEHLAAPEEQMRRLHTLLKPGGRLYLTLPNSASWIARLSGEKWNMLLLEHLWYFSPETVTRFLKRVGFATDLIKPIGYPVDLASAFLRARQTYGDLVPPVPGFLAKAVVTLPIGLMFVRATKAASYSL
jgi:SAM-dependent methyltransferase